MRVQGTKGDNNNRYPMAQSAARSSKTYLEQATGGENCSRAIISRGTTLRGTTLQQGHNQGQAVPQEILPFTWN